MNNLMINIFVDVDYAIQSFEKIQQMDPYRLENMDLYSNLLYIRVSDICYYISDLTKPFCSSNSIG